MDITHIEAAPDGWFIEFSTLEMPVNYFHLTLEKIEDLRVGMVRINKGDESNLNLLVFHFDDEAKVRELFPLAYGDIVGNRRSREGLGLKAVTRDGDEDLKAVLEGAPVRSWNAARQPAPIEDFIKERKTHAPIRDEPGSGEGAEGSPTAEPPDRSEPDHG